MEAEVWLQIQASNGQLQYDSTGITVVAAKEVILLLSAACQARTPKLGDSSRGSIGLDTCC